MAGEAAARPSIEEGGVVPAHDFFLSYAGTDEPWARWLAAQLRSFGYSVREIGMITEPSPVE